MSISQVPASTVTPLASAHEATARRHILSIVTTLSSVRNGETPESDAALAGASVMPSVAQVYEISQVLIGALKSRSSGVAKHEERGAVEESFQTARLIDALKALPSLVEWVAQGVVPSGTSPGLVVAALGQIETKVSQALELLCEACESQRSALEDPEVGYR